MNKRLIKVGIVVLIFTFFCQNIGGAYASSFYFLRKAAFGESKYSQPEPARSGTIAPSVDYHTDGLIAADILALLNALDEGFGVGIDEESRQDPIVKLVKTRHFSIEKLTPIIMERLSDTKRQEIETLAKTRGVAPEVILGLQLQQVLNRVMFYALLLNAGLEDDKAEAVAMTIEPGLSGWMADADLKELIIRETGLEEGSAAELVTETRKRIVQRESGAPGTAVTSGVALVEKYRGLGTINEQI